MLTANQNIRGGPSRVGAMADLLTWGPFQRVSDGESPPDGTPMNPLKEALSSRAGKQRLHILIIEDNRDFADSLELFFELHGHVVEVAYTGIEGVAAAVRDLPDAVICDIGLPEMDGFEVARALRANPVTAGVHLIAVTGYGSESDRRRSMECGFDAHLVKPASAVEILRLIEARHTKGH